MNLCVPTLRTERLILRAWRGEDHEPFAALWADEETARFIGGRCGRNDAWRTMAGIVGHWALRGFGLWALEEKASGAFLGYCGLWRPEGWPGDELGWALLPEAQGRGLATEAARRARRYAYEDLGWTALISLIDPNNHPSIKVARRLGAEPEGQFELRGTMVDIWHHPGPAEAS